MLSSSPTSTPLKKFRTRLSSLSLQWYQLTMTTEYQFLSLTPATHQTTLDTSNDKYPCYQSCRTFVQN